MATVFHECNSCKNIWRQGAGDYCPVCGSNSVYTDWDEQFDCADANESWEYEDEQDND